MDDPALTTSVMLKATVGLLSVANVYMLVTAY